MAGEPLVNMSALRDWLQKRKAAVFLVAGYPGLGGTQEYTFMLARKMLPFCKVYLVMPFDPEQENQFGRPFEELGGKVIRLPAALYARLCSRRYDRRMIGGYQLMDMLRTTAQTGGHNGVVVHSSLDPVSTFFSARWAARHGASVTVFHDFGRIAKKSVSYGINSLLLSLLPRRTSAFVVPSRDVKSKLTRFVARVPDDRVTVINTGIDPLPVIARQGANADKPPLFFMVGRVAEAKAPLVWLKAVRNHIRAGGAGQFVWIGNGPLIEDCRRYIGKYDMGDRVSFTGYVDNVTDRIRGADVLLFSSLWEGGCLPRGILEAIFQGFPCVLPRLPTLVESLGADSGLVYFYEAGDADSLQHVLGQVLKEFESLPEKAGKARLHVLEHHTAQTEFEKTMDLYQRLIA